MIKRSGVLTAIGAAVASVALAVPSAIAAPSSWTITPTGNFTGSAGVTVLTDNNGNKIQCASSAASGNAPTSPVSGSPAQLASISAISFNSPCTGPFSSTWTVTTTPPWQIWGLDYAAGAGTNSTGQTTGEIRAIKAKVTGSSLLGPCTFDVTGKVAAKYNNPSTGGSNGTLNTAGGGLTLTIANKVGGGCGIVGTTASFQGLYTIVNTATGKSPVISG
ncbi:hypothetical protein ACFVG1_07930 [Streptomyces bacillaris]|uniref:Secreted protein n=1 Tax=Streptomyces cavourensis TaxID=67258 RepID=A0AAD0Q9X2_9ACTN|nr:MULTISPECIES: hypothetical protein [Streptomyces]NUW19212.1 hypothetical protein [Streptomyces roseoviolaceus]AXI75026.1 hypothetical protein DTW94_29800 [Streptomyces cavourensis]MBH0245471.1 hypothetical protein [Streptomyces cavourensis]NUV41129.1 hypothetical protein [Streptomyces sp. CAI-24]NUV80006.1 hypothetical protein [Streptomyces sp. CAI-155]